MVLIDNKLEISFARITTLGERIEDLFGVTDAQGQAIRDPALCRDIEQQLKRTLDSAL